MVLFFFADTKLCQWYWPLLYVEVLMRRRGDGEGEDRCRPGLVVLGLVRAFGSSLALPLLFPLLYSRIRLSSALFCGCSPSVTRVMF